MALSRCAPTLSAHFSQRSTARPGIPLLSGSQGSEEGAACHIEGRLGSQPTDRALRPTAWQEAPRRAGGASVLSGVGARLAALRTRLGAAPVELVLAAALLALVALGGALAALLLTGWPSSAVSLTASAAPAWNAEPALSARVDTLRAELASETASVRASLDEADLAAVSAVSKLERQLREMEQSAAARLDAMSDELAAVKSLATASSNAAQTHMNEADLLALVRAELRDLRDCGAELPDYALRDGGGEVVGHSQLAAETPGGPRGGARAGWLTAAWTSLRGDSERPHPRASEWLLSSGAQAPGACLPLDGASGWVDVRLRAPIMPTSFTLEHVQNNIAYDIRSAPRAFSVLGWDARDGTGVAERNLTELGTGEFDVGSTPAQIFALTGGAAVTHVRLLVASNHGLENYTCVYRLRVHGTLA